MTRYAPRNPPPVRQDLIDPRSTASSSAGPVRKTLLNDRRSTRRFRTA